jgi:molybdopterin molybdotransferase
VLTYQQALMVIMQTVKALPPVTVSLDEGHGKILAEDVFSARVLPPADNSAMDGYAYASASIAGQSSLREVGFLPAGEAFAARVAAGETVRIMTGAPLPAGCDTVIPFENVEVGADGQILLRKPVPHGANVRYRGEELQHGEKVLAAGTLLSSGAIGLLAAAGIARLQVYPAPRVAILSTGDELCELDDDRQDGRIINSNAHLLAARLREDGFGVEHLGIARDQPGELETKLRRGLEADLLLSTGGVSVGDRDHVQEALCRIGFTQVFWKVAIKPGKPVLFGMIGSLPVFGLPGNPASSAATYELFVRPALLLRAGHRHPHAPRLQVTLAGDVRGGGTRQQFVWGTLHIVDGALHFHPSQRQGSGQNRSSEGAHALLPVAAGAADLVRGDTVEVIILRLPPGQDHCVNK